MKVRTLAAAPSAYMPQELPPARRLVRASRVLRARRIAVALSPLSAILLLVPLAALGVGCGGDDAKKAASPADAKQVEVRSIVVEHEVCPEGGNRVDAFDANGDNKPDVRKVFDRGGRELCRTTDLNHDGKPELYEYYGPGGETRRREASYTDSGEVTSIEYFEAGKRVRRELDTTGQHRVDTWDYFDPASGKRVKRERDVNGDGRIDQWWMWEGEKLTIAVDKSGDGHPDPEATIVVGGAPAPSVAPGASTLDAPDAAAAPASPAAANAAPAPAATAADAGASKDKEPAAAGGSGGDAGAAKPKGGKAK